MRSSFLKITLATSVLLFLGCSQKNKEGGKVSIREIHIKGSDTEYLMVKDLAEAYMAEHPDVKISVEGGGSNNGISALAENKIEICNSSRAINAEEILAISRNNINPVPIMFSVDALAMITNYRVGVDSLSIEQVSGLFSGKIKNWVEMTFLYFFMEGIKHQAQGIIL